MVARSSIGPRADAATGAHFLSDRHASPKRSIVRWSAQHSLRSPQYFARASVDKSQCACLSVSVSMSIPSHSDVHRWGGRCASRNGSTRILEKTEGSPWPHYVCEDIKRAVRDGASYLASTCRRNPGTSGAKVAVQMSQQHCDGHLLHLLHLRKQHRRLSLRTPPSATKKPRRPRPTVGHRDGMPADRMWRI